MDEIHPVDILAESARAAVLDRGAYTLPNVPQGDSGWQQLVKAARYHKVLTILAQVADAQTPGKVPQRAHAYLRHYTFTASSRALFLSKELLKVVSLLEEEGVPVLAFKGAVLAALAYPDEQLRPFNDLDIFVRKADLSRITEILKAHRYREEERFHLLQGRARQQYLHLNQQCQLVTLDSIYNLDIHFGIVPALYTYPLSFDEMWGRSMRVEIRGGEVRSFGIEDQLLILCYQGVKERWEKLKYVVDVAALVNSQAIDWQRTYELAERIHGKRILHLGLALTQELMDIPLPLYVADAVRQDAPARRLAADVIAKLPDQAEKGIPGFRERFKFHLSVQSSLSSKLRYCWYSLVRNVHDVSVNT